MKKKILLDKEYGWEDTCDAEEDVSYAIDYIEKIDGEFSGTIKVTVTYEE